LQVGNGGTTGTLGSGIVTDDGNLIFNHSNTLSVLFDIAGTGDLTQAGSGLLTLLGNNSYAGVTNVWPAPLPVGPSSPLPAGPSLVLGTPSSATAGTFDLRGFSVTVTSLSLSSGNTGGSNNTVTNTGAATTFTVNNTSPATYGGKLAGA